MMERTTALLAALFSVRLSRDGNAPDPLQLARLSAATESKLEPRSVTTRILIAAMGKIISIKF